MSRRTKGSLALVAALLIAVLGIPAGAFAAPAGSEYILRVPHAQGDHSSGGGAPTTTSSSGTTTTAPTVKHRRPVAPRGPADRRTGTELVPTDTSGSTSFLGALGAALLDPLVLALLGVIAIGSAFALRTRPTAPEV